MPSNVQEVFYELLNKIKVILGNRIKKILLYGSYARGDYNKSSDIDIMILTDLNSQEINSYSNEIWEKCADIEIDKGIVITPLIRNIEEFEAWQDVKPFYMNIVNEGVLLVGEEN